MGIVSLADGQIPVARLMSSCDVIHVVTYTTGRKLAYSSWCNNTIPFRRSHGSSSIILQHYVTHWTSNTLYFYVVIQCSTVHILVMDSNAAISIKLKNIHSIKIVVITLTEIIYQVYCSHSVRFAANWTEISRNKVLATPERQAKDVPGDNRGYLLLHVRLPRARHADRLSGGIRWLAVSLLLHVSEDTTFVWRRQTTEGVQRTDIEGSLTTTDSDSWTSTEHCN